MSNNQLAGFPAFGPRVDTTITYNPRIVTLETPTDLPTTEPATAQVQFVLAGTDLPACSPYPIPWADSVAITSRYMCHMFAYVKNESGGTATIYAKYKTANTPTWSTAVSVSATNNYYYSIGSVGLTTWAIGDTQEIKLYASAAGVKLIKYALIIYPNRAGQGCLDRLHDLKLSFENASLIGGTALVYDAAANYTLLSALFTNLASAVKERSFGCWLTDSANGIFVSGTSSRAWRASTTDVFNHGAFYYPTRIAYTPIL